MEAAQSSSESTGLPSKSHEFAQRRSSFPCWSTGNSGNKVPVAVVSPQTRHESELCAKTPVAISTPKDDQDPHDVGSQLSLLKQSAV